MNLTKFMWETMKNAGPGLWGATLFWVLTFLLSTIAVATTLSAADLGTTIAECDEVMVVNKSGCELDVFVYGAREGTRVPPNMALLVDIAALRSKTVHLRIVGYNRGGTLAGTTERDCKVVPKMPNEKPQRWIWEIHRDDL